MGWTTSDNNAKGKGRLLKIALNSRRAGLLERCQGANDSLSVNITTIASNKLVDNLWFSSFQAQVTSLIPKYVNHTITFEGDPSYTDVPMWTEATILQAIGGGQLTEAITSGVAITQIKADNIIESNLNPPKSGEVILVNADGDTETISYTDYSVSAGVYTFTANATPTNSYALNADCLIRQPAPTDPYVCGAWLEQQYNIINLLLWFYDTTGTLNTISHSSQQITALSSSFCADGDEAYIEARDSAIANANAGLWQYSALLANATVQIASIAGAPDYIGAGVRLSRGTINWTTFATPMKKRLDVYVKSVYAGEGMIVQPPYAKDYGNTTPNLSTENSLSAIEGSLSDTATSGSFTYEQGTDVLGVKVPTEYDNKTAGDPEGSTITDSKGLLLTGGGLVCKYDVTGGFEYVAP